MKQQRLVFIKLICSLMVLALLSGCESEGPPNPNGVYQRFEPEYDCMQGFNVFFDENGDYDDHDVYFAFHLAEKEFYPSVSDTNLTDSLVRYADLSAYAFMNSNRDSGKYIQGGYLVAMNDPTFKPTDTVNGQEVERMGITRNSGEYGFVSTFIFVQALKFNYGAEFEYAKKLAVIHELGHMIDSTITHLCDDDSHNSNSCVMGNGIHSACSPHEQLEHLFCGNDRERIKTVNWK